MARDGQPGGTLLEIADLLFDGDAAAQSLVALVADTRREWASAVGLQARTRVRVALITSFWQTLLLHLLFRATRPPHPRVVLAIMAATNTTQLRSLTIGIAVAETVREWSP